jgi:hypothetical protein
LLTLILRPHLAAVVRQEANMTRTSATTLAGQAVLVSVLALGFGQVLAAASDSRSPPAHQGAEERVPATPSGAPAANGQPPEDEARTEATAPAEDTGSASASEEAQADSRRPQEQAPQAQAQDFAAADGSAAAQMNPLEALHYASAIARAANRTAVLATERAEDEQVRQTAHALVQQNYKSLLELSYLIEKAQEEAAEDDEREIDMATELDQQAEQAQQDLARREGEDFDRAFLERQAKLHEAATDMLEQAAAVTEDEHSRRVLTQLGQRMRAQQEELSAVQLPGAGEQELAGGEEDEDAG